MAPGVSRSPGTRVASTLTLRIVAPDPRPEPTRPEPLCRTVHGSSSTVTRRVGAGTLATPVASRTERGAEPCRTGTGFPGRAGFAGCSGLPGPCCRTVSNDSRTDAGAARGAGSTSLAGGGWAGRSRAPSLAARGGRAGEAGLPVRSSFNAAPRAIARLREFTLYQAPLFPARGGRATPAPGAPRRPQRTCGCISPEWG